MVDAVFIVLHVAVQHGGVRLQSHFMRQTGGFEPLIAVNFVIADDVTHSIGKNLCTTPGKRVDARGLQLMQSFARLERYATSTMVKAFKCTCGKRCLSPEIRSRKY